MEFDVKNPKSVLYLKTHEVTKDFLINTFATVGDNDAPLINPNSTLILDEKALTEANSPILKFKNIKSILGEKTTVGCFVSHLVLFDINFDFTDSYRSVEGDVKFSNKGNLCEYLNYHNGAFTKKVMGSFDGEIANLFLERKIDSSVGTVYVDRAQWLGYTAAIFSCPSLDLKTVNPSKKIRNFRDKKLKENAKAIEEKDLKRFSEIEKEILDYAADELNKDDATGKLIYDSGFNGSFTNNFKVTSIFRGIAPKSDNLSEFEIVTSSLNEGIKKTDIPPHADLAVLGGAGRAKDTALAGYKTKIFNAAFGAIVAGQHGSNCKTKRTSEHLLTAKMKKGYMYRNILDGTKIIQLTPDNFDMYVGKKVQMRTPNYCITREICSVCLGDMSYRLKFRHIGLHVARFTNKLMNLSMKAFHDMSADPDTFNLLDYIEEVR